MHSSPRSQSRCVASVLGTLDIISSLFVREERFQEEKGIKFSPFRRPLDWRGVASKINFFSRRWMIMAREPWEREVDVRTAQERARRNNSECATCGAWLDEDGTCPRCHQPKEAALGFPAVLRRGPACQSAAGRPVPCLRRKLIFSFFRRRAGQTLRYQKFGFY